ncbi:unnamed protein product [Cylicocyclus nassatus]|uniref:Uncharacterized protein n=1 Tax=Cylicocyclus nassatus TaxID=53992 RepID=A0AA36GU26_CYLNA|nr:unnamed protein product [Cylicocyclus nassatus]
MCFQCTKTSAGRSERRKTAPGSSLPKPIPTPTAEEKSDEPLHIKVPPPRIMKARRPMKIVRSSRDPAYKTLEPDMSDWESAKIMKRDELIAENLDKKCSEENDQNEFGAAA